MGGAIAVHVATRQKLAALAALVVIDVVEGFGAINILMLFNWTLHTHTQLFYCSSGICLGLPG